MYADGFGRRDHCCMILHWGQHFTISWRNSSSRFVMRLHFFAYVLHCLSPYALHETFFLLSYLLTHSLTYSVTFNAAILTGCITVLACLSCCLSVLYEPLTRVGSYISGKTGKSQGIWVVGERSGKGQGKFFGGESQENKKWCHQMSDFQAKMRLIWFPLGLRPRPCCGSLQTP